MPFTVVAIGLPHGLTAPMSATAVEKSSFEVEEDSYTTSTLPSRNSGDSRKVVVGRDRTAEKSGFLKFSIPEASNVDTVLVLKVTGGTPGTMEVFSSSNNWHGDTITHSNAPAPTQKLGSATLAGGAEIISIPLDFQRDSLEEVSLVLTRTDRGLTRIASQEAPGNLAPLLKFTAASTLPVPSPSPGPVTSTRTMPIHVSAAPDHGSFIESYEARRAQGWATAFYAYWPQEMRWNAEWRTFVDRHPGGIPVVASPKSVNASNVRTFLDHLPQSWRDQWVMAYHQEPEDDFTTPAERARFRDKVAQMAALVRPYGVANAVHLQEWTINPYNNKPWAGEARLAEFFDVADIDYLSWSLYPAEGRSMRPGIDRIKAFSEKYAPGVPWGITAAGSPVEGSSPIGGQARARRAAIVLDGAQYTAQVGGQAFGWFDFDEYNQGRDQLVSKDSALRQVMQQAATIVVKNP